MIRFLEEQDQILYGEKISDKQEILYEVSKDEGSSSEEVIFMMQDK